MTILRGLHLGRRGAFLVLFGAVYLLVGYSYLTLSPVSVVAVRRSLHLALNVAPLTVWGWVWIAAGAAAVVCGVFCVGRKGAGFATAVVMPALWAGVYLAGWLNNDIPRGWVSAAIYAALAGGVATVAGMSDSDELGVHR